MSGNCTRQTAIYVTITYVTWSENSYARTRSKKQLFAMSTAQVLPAKACENPLSKFPKLHYSYDILLQYFVFMTLGAIPYLFTYMKFHFLSVFYVTSFLFVLVICILKWNRWLTDWRTDFNRHSSSQWTDGAERPLVEASAKKRILKISLRVESKQNRGASVVSTYNL